jgi:tripartite-type tricarboxylate transporter receptor subunit TctC
VKLFLLAATLAFATIAHGQDVYPSHPVTMIIPFPPGGVADLTARAVAPAMERALRQPIVAVNRTGAGGEVGYEAAAKARPDGYTLLMALSSVTIAPESHRLFDRQPKYEMNQLAPIALLSADPTILVVRADSPYRSVRDFVEAAKANPGKINYSSSGVYGTLHVAMEMLAHAAGVKLFHVPYQGAGPAVTALLGGQVEALASGPSAVIAHIKSGKLRALAGWGGKRLAALPELPTFKELGIDVEFYIWAGMFAPAGTPEPAMKTLRDAARQAANDPDFKATMEKLATPIAYLDAPEFAAFVDRDAKMLAAALKRIGRIEDAK